MIEIGSSDAPVVMGVSPHCTPWRRWAELVGLLPKVDEPDEVMKTGTRLQDVVLDMELEEFLFSQLTTRRQATEFHPTRLWQRATPDGVMIQSKDVGCSFILAEVKCVAGQPPPTPRVQDVVQCLHQLLVFEDAEHVRLIYFGALRRERFIIPRHQGALDAVLRAEGRFLELVEKQIPPPVSARDASVLWRAWPLVADRVERLPASLIDVDRMMVDARSDVDEATQRYDEARARIKAAIGDAKEAILPNGVRYTWRPDKNGHRPLRRVRAREDD